MLQTLEFTHAACVHVHVHVHMYVHVHVHVHTHARARCINSGPFWKPYPTPAGNMYC